MKLLQGYHIFIIPVEWKNPVREYIAQDHVRVIGLQTMRGTVRVLAKSKESAVLFAEKSLPDSAELRVVGDVTREELHGVVFESWVGFLDGEPVQ